MTAQRKYLVTGGAGFIGSHLVEALLARGESVVILDDFSSGRHENLSAALKARRSGAPEPTVIEGDVCDEKTSHAAMRDVTHVLHQAAVPSVPRSVADPVTSHTANATGTLALLLAARDAGVARFVYASSSSAYGDSPTQPKVESMPTAPLSPYAVSKLAGEHYCRVFTLLYGLQTVSLRYFNIFGPRQDPNSQYAAVIPRFATAALAGKAPTIYGDGLQSRDFTYIENAVQANLLACDAPAAAAGRAYNVACGRSVNLLDVIGLLKGMTGRSITPVHEPGRPGDVRDSLADISAARDALGYSPAIDFETGLRRTLAALQT